VFVTLYFLFVSYTSILFSNVTQFKGIYAVCVFMFKYCVIKEY